MFTPSSVRTDTVINNTLVIKAERRAVQIDQLPEVFFPLSGQYSLRSKSSHLHQARSSSSNAIQQVLNGSLEDAHRVFVDDKSPYMLGCGQAFSKYGIDAEKGAIVVVRPDSCKFLLNLFDIAVLITHRRRPNSPSNFVFLIFPIATQLL
jgi:phenol 2-monooxygenase